jgi:adenylate cyclase
MSNQPFGENAKNIIFRMGINIGDVIADGEDLYGDGVNIAARLETLSPPGGLCISGPVFDQIKNKLQLDYEDMGEQTVKNIAEPLRVYRIQSSESGRKLPG